MLAVRITGVGAGGRASPTTGRLLGHVRRRRLRRRRLRRSHRACRPHRSRCRRRASLPPQAQRARSTPPPPRVRLVAAETAAPRRRCVDVCRRDHRAPMFCPARSGSRAGSSRRRGFRFQSFGACRLRMLRRACACVRARAARCCHDEPALHACNEPSLRAAHMLRALVTSVTLRARTTSASVAPEVCLSISQCDRSSAQLSVHVRGAKCTPSSRAGDRGGASVAGVRAALVTGSLRAGAETRTGGRVPRNEGALVTNFDRAS